MSAFNVDNFSKGLRLKINVMLVLLVLAIPTIILLDWIMSPEIEIDDDLSVWVAECVKRGDSVQVCEYLESNSDWRVPEKNIQEHNNHR